jgi:hypothetical protein
MYGTILAGGKINKIINKNRSTQAETLKRLVSPAQTPASIRPCFGLTKFINKKVTQDHE